MFKKIFIIILNFLVICSAAELNVENYEQEKAEFKRWSNKLYFAFGKKADANRDRNLSVQEMRDFCARELKEGASSKNEFTLRIMNQRNPKADENKDGILTKAELLSYLDKFLASESKPTQEPLAPVNP